MDCYYPPKHSEEDNRFDSNNLSFFLIIKIGKKINKINKCIIG